MNKVNSIMPCIRNTKIYKDERDIERDNVYITFM